MTGAPRPVRDIVAECMRRERLGLMRPFWSDWDRFAPEETEHVRRRADHLIRLMEGMGVKLTAVDGMAVDTGPSSTVWRYGLTGSKAERLVRVDGERIEVVMISAGTEKVQLRFGIHDAAVIAGRVLTNDREVAKEPGAMTTIAAALECLRLMAIPRERAMEAAE